MSGIHLAIDPPWVKIQCMCPKRTPMLIDTIGVRSTSPAFEDHHGRHRRDEATPRIPGPGGGERSSVSRALRRSKCERRRRRRHRPSLTISLGVGSPFLFNHRYFREPAIAWGFAAIRFLCFLDILCVWWLDFHSTHQKLNLSPAI